MGTFSIGYGFGTTILTPDIDLGPNRFAGVSKLFLYPYSLIFKHRGISHSLFFGTLSRIVYGFFIGVLLLTLGSLLIDRNMELTLDLSVLVKELFLDYNYQIWWHKWLAWLYLGLFWSDFSHILLDTVTTKISRILRYLKTH